MTPEAIAVKIIYNFMLIYGTIFLIAAVLAIFVGRRLGKAFDETAADITCGQNGKKN